MIDLIARRTVLLTTRDAIQEHIDILTEMLEQNDQALFEINTQLETA